MPDFFRWTRRGSLIRVRIPLSSVLGAYVLELYLQLGSSLVRASAKVYWRTLMCNLFRVGNISLNAVMFGFVAVRY